MAKINKRRHLWCVWPFSIILIQLCFWILFKACSTLNAEFVVFLVGKLREESDSLNINILRFCKFQMESWPVIPYSCLFLCKSIFVGAVVTVGSTNLKLHADNYLCVHFFLSRLITFPHSQKLPWKTPPMLSTEEFI